MSINRAAMAHRKTLSVLEAEALGASPTDDFGSLKLVWECTDVDSCGSCKRYDCDLIDGFHITANGSRSWLITNDRGMYLTGYSMRPRCFRSARAAAKYVEDVLAVLMMQDGG